MNYCFRNMCFGLFPFSCFCFIHADHSVFRLRPHCPGRHYAAPIPLQAERHFQRNMKACELMVMFLFSPQRSRFPFLRIQKIRTEQEIIQFKPSEITYRLSSGAFHLHGNAAFRLSLFRLSRKASAGPVIPTGTAAPAPGPSLQEGRTSDSCSVRPARPLPSPDYPWLPS